MVRLTNKNPKKPTTRSKMETITKEDSTAAAILAKTELGRERRGLQTLMVVDKTQTQMPMTSRRTTVRT